MISQIKPHAVLLQETMVNQDFTPAFKGYNVAARLDTAQPRPQAQGDGTSGERPTGGILTLIRDDLPYKPFDAYRPQTQDSLSYVAGTEVHLPGNNILNIVNIYIPPARWTQGQGTQAQEFQLTGLTRTTSLIVAGDANAHAKRWDPFQREDRLGREIEETCDAMDLVVINDGSPTRTNPATGGRSTPDITVVSADMAVGTTWETTVDMGSDHLPILTTVPTARTKPKREGRKRFSWRKAQWREYQRILEERMKDWETTPDMSATAKDKRLTAAILEAAKATIPLGNRRARPPFWNERCEAATRERAEARKQVSRPPATGGERAEAIRRYTTAKQEANDVIKAEKETYLNEKLADMKPDGNMWGLIQSLDGRRSPAKPAVPLERPSSPGQPPKRPAATDSQKANLLYQMYAEVSRIPKSREDKPIKLEARAATRQCTCNGDRTGICSPFSTEEIKTAMSKLRTKKAAGPDGIPNELLKNLPPRALEHLLDLVNTSWTKCDVPASWRKAEIIAIPKKGKPASDPSSYRPISLLSTVSKLAERVVQARLQFWAEARNLINRNQAGFRQGHSTFDQLGRITQTIFDGFESKKPQRAVLATLDFARAYDRVWRDGLIAKMGRMGIPCCVLRWLRALLRDRRARVRWGSSLSRERVFREGLPQGSVLAPLLWLFYINDIDTDVDNGITCSLFADDVALLAVKSSVKACEETLQPALDSIGDWLTKWKVSPSVTKCTSTVFSLDPQDGGGRAKTKLTLQGQELPQTEHATFLGVQLDRQLTLSKHVANLKDKMARRHRCLQVLASRSYGSRKRTLRSAYDISGPSSTTAPP